MISILFIAAEPTENGEGQQGREAREIEDTLRLSWCREQFKFFQRLSVRPEDLSQLMLDVNPNVVHFSASSTARGEICIRDAQGNVVPITPETLANLFAQFADRLDCVVLSRCFSEKQAEAIKEHIPYVIGLTQETSSQAVIAFSKGFYQAMAAQRPIEQAFILGGIQVRLNGILDCPNPTISRKPYREEHGPEDSGDEVLTRELIFNEWIYTGYSSEFIRILAIDPRNQDVIYAGTDKKDVEGGRAIYLSEDGAFTWRPIDGELLKGVEVNDIAISPLSGRVYIATGRGLFFSDDRGARWEADKRFADREVRALAFLSFNNIMCGTGKEESGASGGSFTGVFGATSHPDKVHFLADADDMSSGDLHVSLDGGQTYKTARGVKNLNDISVSFQDNSFVCTATSDMGVLRSTNGGIVSEKTGALDARNVFCVAISPQNLYEIYAGTESGLFMSHNAGDSWDRVEQVPRTQVIAIVFSRMDSRRIFICTNVGIFESRDGGSRWKAINRGLGHLWAMTLAATEKGDIYTGTSGGGVYKKGEDRLNWEAVGLGFRAQVPFLAIEMAHDDLLYGAFGQGVVRSLNGGLTWNQVGYFQTENGRIDEIQNLAVLPEVSTINNAHSGDLFLSSNGGATWQSPDNLSVKAICAGSVEGRIYTSLDNAYSWQLALDLEGDLSSQRNRITALIAPPQIEGMLFAGSLGAGIYSSADLGRSWQPSSQGINDLNITEITAIPGSSLLLCAASAQGQLYRSVDLGRSWQPIPSDFGDSPIFGIASDEACEVIFLATEGSGAFKTVDGGRSWRPVNAGLNSLKAYTIVTGPEEKNSVYLGTSKGVYVSKDGADSWTHLGSKELGPAIVNRLSFSHSTPELLFAAASNGLFMILTS